MSAKKNARVKQVVTVATVVVGCITKANAHPHLTLRLLDVLWGRRRDPGLMSMRSRFSESDYSSSDFPLEPSLSGRLRWTWWSFAQPALVQRFD